MCSLAIRIGDMTKPEDASDLVSLLDAYASDTMGGCQPLPESVKIRLPVDLAKIPSSLVIIASVDGVAAGVAVCFEGYSTFAASPLINLHDLIVLPSFRGTGVARALLQAVESEARRRKCCKITLEVLSNNHRARGIYARAGFAGYELDPSTGHALFIQKILG